jgi:hypothetical protein
VRARDGWTVLGVAVWTVVVLLLDRSAGLGQQHLLGLGTWLVLLLALRSQDRGTRVQVAVVVVFATGVELVCAGWLGVYLYRLENVPAFVPPGHGLVYLAALALGRAAWAHAHARALLGASLTVGGLWALWGVTLSDRPDALGAFWYACLLLFAWRGRSPLLYASAFLVVSGLEILGTSLGTWTWQPVDPLTGAIPAERHRRRLRLVRRGGAVRHPAAAVAVGPVEGAPAGDDVAGSDALRPQARRSSSASTRARSSRRAAASSKRRSAAASAMPARSRSAWACSWETVRAASCTREVPT